MFKNYFKFVYCTLPQFLYKFASRRPCAVKQKTISIIEMSKKPISKDLLKPVSSRSKSSSSSSGSSRPPVRGRNINNSSPRRAGSSGPVDMSGEVANFVRNTISHDQVVIFSKTYCPYCTMAKDVFKKMEKPFTVVELDKRDDGNSIQDVLKEITGARTVPRVFLNGECIGGGTDVQSLYDSGQLQTMLVKKM